MFSSSTATGGSTAVNFGIPKCGRAYLVSCEVSRPAIWGNSPDTAHETQYGRLPRAHAGGLLSAHGGQIETERTAVIPQSDERHDTVDRTGNLTDTVTCGRLSLW